MPDHTDKKVVNVKSQNYDTLPDSITDRMVTIIGLPGKHIKALVYEHTGHIITISPKYYKRIFNEARSKLQAHKFIVIDTWQKALTERV